MGKLIVPIIIGLLMGISGGGFFAVHQASAAHAAALVQAKKHGLKPAAGDSSHAEGDSAHADGVEAHGDSAEAATPDQVTPDHATPDQAAPAADSAPAAAHGNEKHVGAPTAAHTPTAATTAVVEHVEPAPTSAASVAAHEQRMAKIFSTMSAKDAARVLAQMSDHDVGVILRQLSDRQAAAILTTLPAQRAATLTQLQAARP
jgi:MgtE intracellular N domain